MIKKEKKKKEKEVEEQNLYKIIIIQMLRKQIMEE